MRHRKSCARSSSVGALKLVIFTPCGSTRPTVCRSTPPLPEVSIPCSTSSTRRSEPVVRSAHRRSCQSDSSSPSAARAALPAFLPPSNPEVSSVTIALRLTAPGGSRCRWVGSRSVTGSSWHDSVDRPVDVRLVGTGGCELLPDDGEGQPGRVSLPGEQPGQTPGRGDLVDAVQGAELLADQVAGGLLLQRRVEVVQRGACGRVVDTLASQLLGQGPPGQAAAALPALDPGPGERLVVDQPDLAEPVEQPLGQLVGHVLPGQPVAQLLAAARLAGQRVEQDGASDRPRGGVGPVGDGVGRGLAGPGTDPRTDVALPLCPVSAHGSGLAVARST